MTGAPKCLKCNALAKHDPVDGVMTTCGRHSAAHAERAAERMRQRHADPEFAKAHAERMRALNADPEFAKANAERMRALNADPEFNPLVLLTPAERADYDVLKRAGYSRADALRAIGRLDILDARKEAAE